MQKQLLLRDRELREKEKALTAKETRLQAMAEMVAASTPTERPVQRGMAGSSQSATRLGLASAVSFVARSADCRRACFKRRLFKRLRIRARGHANASSRDGLPVGKPGEVDPALQFSMERTLLSAYRDAC